MVEAPASPRQESSPESPPCNCKAAYWRDVAIDVLLELQAARQRLASIDEDQVALCAVRSLEVYRMLVPDGPKPDDPRNDIAFWRAKWRLRLAGEDV